MLCVAGGRSARRLANIVIGAWGVVSSSAGVIVDYPVNVYFFQFVFRVDQLLS